MVGGAVLIALLTAQFLYSRAGIWFSTNGRANMPVVLGIVAGFLIVFALAVFQIINRINVVDFLIATDSEMKKVNWTTKAELIGSTKVVIIFMLFIAFFDIQDLPFLGGKSPQMKFKPAAEAQK